MKIKGFLEAFSEMGAEGIIWILYKSEQSSPPKNKSYENVRVIENGDTLTIFKKSKVVWSGVIDLDTSKKVCGNYRVHGIQKGVDEELWLSMFKGEYKAELEKA